MLGSRHAQLLNRPFQLPKVIILSLLHFLLGFSIEYALIMDIEEQLAGMEADRDVSLQKLFWGREGEGGLGIIVGFIAGAAEQTFQGFGPKVGQPAGPTTIDNT